jgi:uncharacterized protein (DUF58 family)
MKINKKIKILDFKLSKILNGWLFWAYKSLFIWTWMEFSEHVKYNFWDNVKDIDWKASSRTDEMYIKKYEEQRDLNILFVLDNTKSIQFWSEDITKKDLLIEIFYALAFSAYYNNDNIWWLIFSWDKFNFIDYKKSKNNIYKIIDILENSENNLIQNIENKWNLILNNLIKRQIKNNLIFILTDDISKPNEKLLRLIWSKNEIIYINIFDYFENNLVKLDLDTNFNFSSEFLNINLANKEKIKRYRDLRKKKIRYLKEVFNKNRIWYVKIDTKTNIYKELIKYFITIRK